MDGANNKRGSVMSMTFKTIIDSDEAPITRKVGDASSSGRVYVPKGWSGREVIVILKDKEDVV